jgi:hypothetical protein
LPPDLKVVEFPYSTTLQDIPGKLRLFADRIESGEIADVEACVVIFNNPECGVVVHGLGTANAHTAYYMLGKAMHKLDCD